LARADFIAGRSFGDSPASVQWESSFGIVLPRTLLLQLARCRSIVLTFHNLTMRLLELTTSPDQEFRRSPARWFSPKMERASQRALLPLGRERWEAGNVSNYLRFLNLRTAREPDALGTEKRRWVLTFPFPQFCVPKWEAGTGKRFPVTRLTSVTEFRVPHRRDRFGIARSLQRVLGLVLGFRRGEPMRSGTLPRRSRGTAERTWMLTRSTLWWPGCGMWCRG
jgi:hypothetical protein